MVRRVGLIPVVLFLIGVVVFDVAGSQPSVGTDGTPSASPIATPLASPIASPVADCTGVAEYLAASARIALEHETLLAQAANPGALSGADAEAVAQAFVDVRDEVVLLTPPAILTGYHTAYLDALDQFAQVFSAIAAGGMAGAVTHIEAASVAVDAWTAAEEQARAVCPAEWTTVADVQGTPPD